MQHFIASSEEVKADRILERKLEGQSLIFVRYEGEVKAYSGICPHQGATLAQGSIEGDAIVCPLHQRAFSCKNGYELQHHTQLASFPVVEKNGEVYVLLEKEVPTSACPHHRTMAELPQPKGSPIMGNLSQFKANNKPRVLEAWAKECGSIYKISLMGKKFIVSTDPDFNIQLYKNRPDKFRRFGKIDEVMSEMGIKGVFNAEGEQWKIHRKLTAEALNTRNVHGFFPTLREITERLLQRWQQKQSLENVLDVQKEMMRFTVDITTRIAFGHDTHSLEHEEDVLQRHLQKIFPMINKRITTPIPIWRFVKSKADKELDLALKGLYATIQTFIQQTRQKLAEQPLLKQAPENFLQALLVEKEKSGAFSDEEIYGNVFTLLLAGEDTTSNSIAWALYYLAQYPSLYAQLRQEAQEVMGHAPVVQKVEDLSRLTLTEAVAMETLRIKPVTPTLFLESLEDQRVNGLLLKKGVTVMMQSKVAQTDDAHFTRADEFLPERWLGSAGFPQHTMEAFRTFGAGPRFCPGRTLALHEMKMALSMIAKNFDIELAVAPDEVQEQFAFTMFPSNLLLRIKRANGST